ncbi:MAG: hypothetical protein UV74_C0013G0556 [Candidatus Woesebacteria bacterium GW2011_GWB1_43_14]|uniref:Uncharacterized protein n=1 Tax=Candidatus Woesebacteria bacterium GW2011_GWB1_43_14 TaxID=1618578 RepID=A0A0G1DID0_9BACT|nr:MAG: hypothetical protein UT21_C0001G0269 [Candidatus Woesebacteria bacterium GW2011_GWA1_39_11b]KKS77987.1 MAG: hypothetical protein UV51_C0003G0022 [Candidatus Woesebacteria bacterium GW2011_GWC1_42_9]KKS97434.1 MAG: hypothetical protein UV74_C0013G0556 [Candidatus Woesebacteria bacterium GW2011_GWB1_43_14]
MSLERADFIRADLFLWIIFFLAARSAKEIALITSTCFLVFLAMRIAISKFFLVRLLTEVFLLEDLRARFAVTVTGILVIIKYNRGQVKYQCLRT